MNTDVYVTDKENIKRIPQDYSEQKKTNKIVPAKPHAGITHQKIVVNANDRNRVMQDQ